MTPLATALSFVLFAQNDAAFSEQLRAQTHVSGGLTAAEAAQRAQVTSGEVAARRAEVEAADAAVAQSDVAFFPRLAGTARYTRLSSIEAPLLGVAVAAPGAPLGPLAPNAPLVNVPIRFPVLLDQTSFQATLAVPLSDYVLRIAPNHTAAVRTEAAAQLGLEASRRRTAAEAKVLYYGWARAKLSTVVADAAVAQARGHLEDVRKAFDAGVASRADALRVEAQLATAQQAAVGTRAAAVALEARLRTAMHVAGAEPLAIGEAIDRDLPLAIESHDLDRLAGIATGARPEVRALDATIAAVAAQARAAGGGAAPSLAVVGEVTDANPNPRYVPAADRFATTWSVTAQLSWSPNDTAAALEARRALRARVDQAVAQRQLFLDGLRVELAGALEAMDTAASAQVTSAQAVASAAESYRVRRTLFQNGRATSVELTDAETELTRARLAALDAHIEARVAQVQLDHALGRDL